MVLSVKNAPIITIDQEIIHIRMYKTLTGCLTTQQTLVNTFSYLVVTISLLNKYVSNNRTVLKRWFHYRSFYFSGDKSWSYIVLLPSIKYIWVDTHPCRKLHYFSNISRMWCKRRVCALNAGIWHFIIIEKISYEYFRSMPIFDYRYF